MRVFAMLTMIVGVVATSLGRSALTLSAGQPGPQCANIECGELNCPAGFSQITIPGHCCPYCDNPDVKVSTTVNGASGANGGKQSTFCPDVWCFPTLCTSEVTAATTTNGQCCPECPSAKL